MTEHKAYGPYEKYIKRPQDFICALLAIIVLSPVLLVVAVLVKVNLGSPVIFTQERPGKDGKIFKLYKFRSMIPSQNGIIDPNELLNILKGDMSVVGPRPLLVQYLSRYNEHQARRHEVRPGFTGLAQIKGRNTLSWEDKFEEDVYYVDHVSFLEDWKIIFLTVKTVIKKEGINSDDSVTMTEFMGSEVTANAGGK